jgi:hypothetical protein
MATASGSEIVAGTQVLTCQFCSKDALGLSEGVSRWQSTKAISAYQPFFLGLAAKRRPSGGKTEEGFRKRLVVDNQRETPPGKRVASKSRTKLRERRAMNMTQTGRF